MLAAALVLAFVFATGVAAARYQSRQVDRAVLALKSIIIKTDDIAEELIGQNYAHADHVSNPAVRAVDTGLLPLVLTERKLAETGAFAYGMGGGVAVVEGRLLAMDRLGNIFTFPNNEMERTDYDELPTNLRDFVVERVKAGERDPPTVAHYLAFDAVTSRIFVSHQRFNANTNRQRFVVSALSIDKQTLRQRGTWQTIFESEDITQSDTDLQVGGGGKLIVADGRLYFTVGDYAEGRRLRLNQMVAQDPQSSFGKFFEYDLRTQQIRKVAIGLRNPMGLVRTTDGTLIATDSGPEGGDELNVMVEGGNYGWPYQTYGTLYGHFSWPLPVPAPRDFTFVQPLFAWVPSPAISAIIQVHEFSPGWSEDLLVGSLKAQTVYRLKYVDGHVIYSEPVWVGHRVRDIAQMGTRLVLMTDDPSLMFIDIDQQRLIGDSKAHSTIELEPELKTCMTCHHFGPSDPSSMAPSLSDILRRTMAGDDFANYSQGLKRRKTDKWTERSLSAFLRNPSTYGSTMPNPNLSEQDLREIVRLLTN